MSTATSFINTEEQFYSMDKFEFEKFYKQYYRYVYTICYKMTFNFADAEDLTHEIFLQVHKGISKFRGNSTITHWLRRITINQVLMKFRQASYRREKLTEDGEISKSNNNQYLSPKFIENIAIREAITELPEGSRKVLLLYDIAGYEHHEVADMLKITVGTSKSQLHKARTKIRSYLFDRTSKKS